MAKHGKVTKQRGHPKGGGKTHTTRKVGTTSGGSVPNPGKAGLARTGDNKGGGKLPGT